MTREQLLKDTIDYYSENVLERRCVSGVTDVSPSRCFYSPVNANKPNSKGCAIGRLIPSEEDKEILDKAVDHGATGTGIGSILKVAKLAVLIPPELRILGQDFLCEIQILHDLETAWDKEGLSTHGKEKVNQMIRQYSLDITPYKF